MRYLIPMLALLLAGALHADERGDALRKLHAKYEESVVVLTWTSTQSAMGQEMETEGSATGLRVGDGTLIMVSDQVFGGGIGQMASMFGRGESTGPENFMVQTADGEVEAVEVHKSEDENLRWFRIKDDAKPVEFNKAAVAQIGDEVVIIGAYDKTLNFARFFKTARVNSVVEEGKYFGLDGSVQDCLGGVVVTLGGEVLGVIAQKKGEAAAAGGGGLGRMLGGLSDPQKALGNRVLMTSAVFAEELAVADKAEGGEVTTSAPIESSFEGTVNKATWIEDKKQHFVLIDVAAEQTDIPGENEKVSILGEDDKEIVELTITRVYHADPMDKNSPVEQIGGFLSDPDKKLTIAKGARVIVPVKKQPAGEAASGFRGIDRFRKVGKDVLKDNYGGATVGFMVSQIPAKDSACGKAGIKSGDVITKVGDTSVTEEMTLKEFTDLLASQEGKVTLTIHRKGEEATEIKVGK